MLVLGGVLAMRCGPRQSSRGVQLLTLAAATLAAGAATTMQLAESNSTNNSEYKLVTTALSALFAIVFACAAAMRQRAKRREGSFKVSESFTMVAVGTNDDANMRDNDYEPDARDKVNGDKATITTTHHTNNDHFDNNNNNDDDGDGDEGHEQRTRAGWNQTDQGTVRQSTDDDDLRAREQVEESNDEHDEHTESEVQSGKSVSQLYDCY